MNRYDTRPTSSGRAGSRGFANGMALIVVLFLATAAGLVWVAMGIVASDRWPIRWLEVEGEFQRVSAEQLRANLATQMGSNFFTVNLASLSEAAGRLHWVSSVQVRKTWPDTVTVRVEEYRPVAHWNRGELISSHGETFSVPEADGIQGLPWLQGPDERLDDVLEAWVGFNEKLLPLGLEVQRLTLDRRGSWSMVMNNGTQVRLGRRAPAERLERLLVSWEPLLQRSGMPPQDIDLRYTNGFAVSWPRAEQEQSGTGS